MRDCIDDACRDELGSSSDQPVVPLKKRLFNFFKAHTKKRHQKKNTPHKKIKIYKKDGKKRPIRRDNFTFLLEVRDRKRIKNISEKKAAVDDGSVGGVKGFFKGFGLG